MATKKSRYTLYLDESQTHKYNPASHKNEQYHFCMAGIIIADDDYAKYILTWVVHNVADLKTSDVEFVFKTESKSSETQNLFNDIKALQKHHSIVKIGNARPEYIQDKAFWELYNELNL